AYDHDAVVDAAGPGALTSTSSLDLAPVFADAHGRLAADSPLRDAGQLGAHQDAVDRDGNPRVAGSAVDIGAYELAALPPVPGDGGGGGGGGGGATPIEPQSEPQPEPIEPQPEPTVEPIVEGQGSAADTTPPAIKRLRRKGRTARFVLTEPARLTLKMGTRTRTRTLAAGRHRVRVPLPRRGARRLTLQAVDAVGNASAPRTLRVRARR
ncbi:MAG TPA: choice-of-anchor Q domain-containing protein, partial [Capillimicrobium sp.]